MSQATSPQARSGLVVVALCFLTIVFDGYDLIVYGSALPSLLAEGWGMGPAQAGAIGSYALAGMLLGAWAPVQSPTWSAVAGSCSSASPGSRC